MSANRQRFIAVFVVTILALVGVHIVFNKVDTLKSLDRRLEETSAETDVTFKSLNTLISQRNRMSRELNIHQQLKGQQECERMKTQNAAVSSSGGWCADASLENSSYHKTDRQLATALAEFFTGKYVGSFGDGPGRYKQLLLDTGLLKGYDAYDGAPFSEKTSEGRVQYLDLTLPQYGLPLYDWVMSLEVAEHIPKEYESIYVDNIVRHAKEGIILSWAKLGQDGHSHVNNRPFEYVKDLLGGQGFEHDPESSIKLQNTAMFPWFKWNINVYRRINLSKDNLYELETVWT